MKLTMLLKSAENNYLDTTKLSPMQTVTVRAFLLRANTGTDKRGSGFITFYLRDVNGRMIEARMFNVADFYESGFQLSGMTRRPVLVKATTQVFNGSLSLIVKEIQGWEGEFDYSQFLGSLPDAEENLQKVNAVLERLLGVQQAYPNNYISTSYVTICNGLTGGYVKLLQLYTNAVVGYNGCPGVDTKELLLCAVKVANTYARVLDMRETFELPLTHEVMHQIYSSVQDMNDVKLQSICTDALMAILENTPPQHLYAHIIYETFKAVEKNLRMTYEYILVVKGSSKKVGDDVLARY